MDNSQLLKGILQACVLSIVFQGETYGYQIIQELSTYGFVHVKDGTLYPILARLEKKRYINSRIGKSSLGPKRKYFTITKEGEHFLNHFKKEYITINNIATKILFREGDQDERA